MTRLIAALLLIVTSGCVTTYPDGTVSRPDTAAVIATMESTLALLEQGYAAYLDRLERADVAEAARLERDLDLQRERIELIRQTLDGLYRRQGAR